MFSLARSPGCANCGSASIARSRRHGLIEFLLHYLLFISPYRCKACDVRHFRFGHTQRHPDSAAPKHAH